LVERTVRETLTIAETPARNLRDLGCNWKTLLREERCMDKQARTRKDPRQLILLAAVEITANIEASQAGPSELIPCASSPDALAGAIRLLLDQGCCPQLFIISPGQYDGRPFGAGPIENCEAQRPQPRGRFSPRHREVLGLIAQGMTNKMIARKLGLAEGTVKSHLVQIFKVLGVHNRTAAVMAARESFASAKPQLVAEGHPEFGRGNRDLRDATANRRRTGVGQSSSVCLVRPAPASPPKAKD
jgi:DNA-binding NarL/FixJ family response regulator